MRWKSLCHLPSVLLFLLPAVGFAYEIDQPQSMDDVLRVMDEEIPLELSAMQCGGWAGESVMGSAFGEDPLTFVPDGRGYVSHVVGVPGRRALPVADIDSGMATRIERGGNGVTRTGEFMDDGYEYPDDALGLSTRCPLQTDSLPKLVWSYSSASWMEGVEVKHMYFEDPPCIWRPNRETVSPHSPEICGEFCEILNEQKYPDCFKVVGALPSEDDPDAQLTCAMWCMKYTCTDDWTGECNTSLRGLVGDGVLADLNGGVDPPTPPEEEEEEEPDGEEILATAIASASLMNQFPNCRACLGEECRCGRQAVDLEQQTIQDPREEDPRCLLQVFNVDGRTMVGKTEDDMTEAQSNSDFGAPGDLSELSDDDADTLLGCRKFALDEIRKSKGFAGFDIEKCRENIPVEEADGENSEDGEIPEGPGVGLMGGVYSSFYRDYEARHGREKLESIAPDDDAEGRTEVACYGFYREIDHKQVRLDEVPGEELTEGSDEPEGNKYRRCVVNMDLEDRIQTQKGKGEFGANTDILEEDDVPRAAEGEVWDPSAGRGFSFLNTRRTRSVAEGLLQLDKALSVSAYPIGRIDADGQEERLEHPRSLQIRDFDDTGPLRWVARWWKEQQNRAAQLGIPASVHLLLPPEWPLGLDQSVSAAARQRQESIAEGSAADATERRIQPVDIQVGAVPGLLDDIVEILESGLLFRLEERPIYTPIFDVNREEALALRDAICLNAMRRSGATSCDNAPLTDGEQRGRSQLEQIASYDEEVRLLRTELADYAGQLVSTQRDIVAPIRRWLDEHKDAYARFLEQREAVLSLAREWREVEKLAAIFPNMPYCMDKRFTTPIYSLLSPWLRIPKQVGNLFVKSAPEEGMPRMTFVPQAVDAVIDLSLLKLRPTMVSVPVLKPIITRVDVTQYAPGRGERYPESLTLPDISAIRDAIPQAATGLPEICTPDSPSDSCFASNPPTMTLPALLDADQAALIEDAIEEIRLKVEEMSKPYGRFWRAAGPLYPQDLECIDDQEGFASCADPYTGGPIAGNLAWWLQDRTAGAWTDADAIIDELKPNMECIHWDWYNCFFTENELIEEIIRLTSHPMAQLAEDRVSRGKRREYPIVCLPDDDSCQILSAEERFPAAG